MVGAANLHRGWSGRELDAALGDSRDGEEGRAKRDLKSILAWEKNKY